MTLARLAITKAGSRMAIQSFLAVFLGAGIGAVVRWQLGAALNPLFPTVPLGTLAANLSGGFLIGVAIGLIARFEALPPDVRLFVTTGFLGGLTTFSTFSGEVVTLIARQQFGWAVGAVGLHVVGSLCCTGLGIAMLHLVLPAEVP